MLHQHNTYWLSSRAARFLSTVRAVEEKTELPYVHIGDRVIVKGKSCISRSAVPVEAKQVENATPKKPSFRNVSTNYIFDRNIARKVAYLISQHHSERNLFVEINPGIGCLTAELLNNGLKSLHLIESNQSFLEYLKMYRAFSQHVTVSNQRFSYFGDAMSVSSMWGSALTPKWSWESDPQASIFSVIPPRQERFLIPWLVNMISSWHDFGRFRYFFIVSDRLLWRCTNSEIATSGNFRHYTVGHILASTLFDMKPLAKMNKSEFVPPVALSSVEQKAKSKKDTSNFEASSMAITVVEPKRELCNKLKLSECTLFAAFVRQFTARRHARIIPTVERLLPGMGLSLLDIPEITSPSARIGDLKPSSFLEIFHLMKKSPHFVPELFLPSTTSQSLSSVPVPDSSDVVLEPPPPVRSTRKRAAKSKSNNTAEEASHTLAIDDQQDDFANDSDSEQSNYLLNSYDSEYDASTRHDHSFLL